MSDFADVIDFGIAIISTVAFLASAGLIGFLLGITARKILNKGERNAD